MKLLGVLFFLGVGFGVQAAAVEEVSEVEVFDEKSSFEGMLAKRKELERNVASMNVSGRVIAVRRELGLTQAEADAAPQDIVVNAGSDSGLTEGMVLTVERRIPVLDPYRDNQPSELQVAFALVKVVLVQKDVAVARIEKVQPIRVGVGVGTRGILIGDYVGLGGQLR